MAIVPLARFAPDRAKFNTDALSSVNNVVPAVDGWKPLKQIVPTPAIYMYLTYDNGDRITYDNGDRIIIALDWSDLSGSIVLPDTATAYFRATKRDGTEILFAGTGTQLLKYRTDQNVWEDVSSTTYASDVPWVIKQHGDVVYAQNGFDVEQMFDVETDTVFSDNTGAPICRVMEVFNGFLWRGDIVSWPEEGYSNEPRMIMCSAYNNPQDNVLQNRNNCDFQIFATGTQVKGFAPFGQGCIVEMADARHAVTVTMDDYTFVTSPIEEGRGTPAAYSLGMIGANDYVIYRDDGFWRINGSGSRPIGDQKVNQFFLEDCDQEERDSIRACVDPENLVVWFSYTDNSGNRKMLGYHYVVDEWTASDLDVVVAATARTFAYGTTIPVSGLLRFSIIDSNGQLGYLVGDPAEATFGTNEVLHSNSRSWVNGLRLVTDASTYSVIVTTKDVLGGSTRSRASSTPSARSGLVSTRADGRTHRYDFTIPAGTNWTTATVADVDVAASGRS